MIDQRLKKLITPDSLHKAFCKHAYVFHTDGKINLFGIRNNDYSVGTFNDVLGIHYVENEQDVLILHQGSVDPGSYYMNHPMQSSGTAVIRFQQVIDGWAPGYHMGYKALVQVKPAWFFRITTEQFEKDGRIIRLSDKTPVFEQIGCNMHRVNSKFDVFNNTNASAGCQVRNLVDEYNKFIELTWIVNAKYDYTVFPEKDFI